MALINCTECGKAVSDKATICIGCGAPLAPAGTTTTDTDAPKPEKREKPSTLKLWLWIPLGLVGVFVMYVIAEMQNPESQERMRDRLAIEICWKDQGKPTNSAGTSNFLTSACKDMENEFRKRWKREP